MLRKVFVAVLLLGPVPLAVAEGPKLGEKFKAAVARTAKEADAIEQVPLRAIVLGNTGNARALAGDKAGALDDLHKAALMARGIDVPAIRATQLAPIGLGLARAGDQAGAREAFREALQATDAIDFPFFRLTLLAEIGLAQARGGDKGGARETFAEAAKVVEAPRAEGARGPDLVRHVYATQVITKQVEAGLVDEVLGVVQEAKLLQGGGDRIALLGALERAMTTASRADRRRVVDWARERAEAMKDGEGPFGRNYDRVDLLVRVAKWEARLGDFEAADRIAESLGGKDKSSTWRNEARLAIAQARIDAGDREIARDLLRDVFARLGETRNPFTLLEIARAQARIDDLEGVSRTVAALSAGDDERRPPAPGGEGGALFEDGGGRVEAQVARARGLAILGMARAARGDAEGARRSFREATDLARAAAKVAEFDFQAAEAWKEIASAQALAGDVAAAVKTAGAAADFAGAARPEAPRPAPPPPPPVEKPGDGPELPPPPPPLPPELRLSKEDRVRFARSEVLEAAFDALLKAGDRDAAQRLLDADPAGLDDSTKLDDLVLAHVRAGELDAALTLLDRLPGPSERASTLHRIAEEAARRGAREKEKKAP